ncbi:MULTISPECIES: PerC family transcriptional regulator [Enterobacterales]|uniref:PerC family transcriptional regulator n=1 Tax=Enterobacterales TaxID=91347 RepID=UPI002ED8967D
MKKEHSALPDNRTTADQKTKKPDSLLFDEIAISLEKRGLWRRAAVRWLAVMDSEENDKIKRRQHFAVIIATAWRQQV